MAGECDKHDKKSTNREVFECDDCVEGARQELRRVNSDELEEMYFAATEMVGLLKMERIRRGHGEKE